MSDLGERLTARQQYWQEHLERCAASGQSVREYAVEHDLKVNTLYFYRRRLGSAGGEVVRRASKPRLVRAQVASATLPCRVHLRNGVTVELGVGQNEFSALLSTLSTLA